MERHVKSMKKISLLIDSLGSGGAQRQIVYLAKGLKRAGYLVNIAVYHDEPFFEKELINDQIDVIKFLDLNYHKRLICFRSFIRNTEPDWVIAFLDSASLIGLYSTFGLKKTKLLVSERNAMTSGTKKIKSILSKNFMSMADCVVANSASGAINFKRHLYINKSKEVHVIYNAVSEGFFSIKSPLKKTDEILSLVVFASYQPSKNIFGLLKAVNLLPSDIKKKIRVEWYGGDKGFNIRAEALRYIEENNLLDIISLNDETQEVIEKLAKSDLVGLFSFYEGLPNSICEAMAAGKTIIASDISDNRVLLGDRFVFNPNSVSDIIELIVEVVTNQDRFLSKGSENRARALKLFNEKLFIEKYIKIIESYE